MARTTCRSSWSAIPRATPLSDKEIAKSISGQIKKEIMCSGDIEIVDYMSLPALGTQEQARVRQPWVATAGQQRDWRYLMQQFDYLRPA